MPFLHAVDVSQRWTGAEGLRVGIAANEALSTDPPAASVDAEDPREDAWRDLGWEIVRRVWSDRTDPAALLERLERAFARGQKR